MVKYLKHALKLALLITQSLLILTNAWTVPNQNKQNGVQKEDDHNNKIAFLYYCTTEISTSNC